MGGSASKKPMTDLIILWVAVSLEALLMIPGIPHGFFRRRDGHKSGIRTLKLCCMDDNRLY